MLKNRKKITTLLYIFASILTILFVGIGQSTQANKTCKNVRIEIESPSESYFFDENSIKYIVGVDNELRGERLGDISLVEVENKLMKTGYIEKVSASIGANDILYINMRLRKPIARVVNLQKGQNQNSFYMDTQLHKMPLTSAFSARVLIVSGNFIEVPDSLIASDSTLIQMSPLLNYIDESSFWRAQISEISIDQDGQLIIFPEIGTTKIYFGALNNYEQKFRNLMAFYQNVLSKTGWNYYKAINLKFDNQVIGIKR